MRSRIKTLARAMLGARLHLTFTQHRVTVLRRAAGWRTQPVMVAEQPLAEHAFAEPQRLAVQCATLLGNADCVGLPLCITLTDESVRLFMVTPPNNASRLDDLKAAAIMRFAALYGDAPSAWSLQADWNTNAPFLACAVPRTVLATLQQVAKQNKMPLLSIAPRFVGAWNQFQHTVPADTWFGVIQDHHLSLGAIAQTPKLRLEAVRSIAIPEDGHTPHWLHEQLSRMAMQLNLAPSKHIRLVGNRHHWWGSDGTDVAAAISTLAVNP